MNINRFARRFRRIVQSSPRILQILEAMMNVRRPSVTEIARIAGVSSATVSRAIAKLRSEGLTLKGLVDYGVVGIGQAIHVYSALEGDEFPRPALLRWVVEGAIPPVAVANTLLPKGAEDKVIKEIESSFLTCETFRVTNWIPPRHRIKRWFRPAATTFIIRWEELLNEAENLREERPHNQLTRFDPLDPLILSILEKSPFAKGVEIREALVKEHGVRVRYQRVMVHLRRRIFENGGFVGAALATTPLDADRSFTAVLMLKGAGAEKLTMAMLTHPFFHDAYVGERVGRSVDRRIIIRAHIPVTELSNLVRFLMRAGESGYLNKWRMVVGERSGERVNVPNMKEVIGLSREGPY